MSARLIAAAPAGFHRYILLVRALCWVRAREGNSGSLGLLSRTAAFFSFLYAVLHAFHKGAFLHDLQGYDSRHGIVGAYFVQPTFRL